MTDLPALPERYRVIRKLGSGGMGHVWLAEDTWLNRQVALKQLIPAGGDTTDLARRRRRVLQEARALAKIKHPAIVPIHDLFDVKRDPWIVMEYIKGHSLDQLISAGRLNERSIAQIGLRVLGGLVAAHQEGIVHRDVKPANVIVATSGTVFLIDFGIARSASDPALTGMAIVGTVAYLAPELLNGAKADPAADIWSLGVTLFYALEGYSPFQQNKPNTQAIMTAILTETPALTRRGPLADITLRMLAKDPGQRAVAADVRLALDRVVRGEPKPQPGPAPRREPPVRPVPARPVTAATAGRTATAVPGGLRDEVLPAGPDEGAAMLASLDAAAAARILAGCPGRRRGQLLQEVADIDPGTAATILPMLLADAAGRALGGLRPKSAAALLAAMPVPEAARILGSTDTRAAASAVMELLPSQAAAQLAFMPDRKRAAEVLSRTPSESAVAIARADRGFARRVLPYLTGPLQPQVRQAAGGS